MSQKELETKILAYLQKHPDARLREIWQGVGDRYVHVTNALHTLRSIGKVEKRWVGNKLHFNVSQEWTTDIQPKLKLHRLYEDYQRADGTVDYKAMCDDLVEPVNETENQVESLGFLAEWSGIKYNTLARAAKEGRLDARRSGNVWLSDRQAVKTYRENAVFKPRKLRNC